MLILCFCINLGSPRTKRAEGRTICISPWNSRQIQGMYLILENRQSLIQSFFKKWMVFIQPSHQVSEAQLDFWFVVSKEAATFHLFLTISFLWKGESSSFLTAKNAKYMLIVGVLEISQTHFVLGMFPTQYVEHVRCIHVEPEVLPSTFSRLFLGFIPFICIIQGIQQYSLGILSIEFKCVLCYVIFHIIFMQSTDLVGLLYKYT